MIFKRLVLLFSLAFVLSSVPAVYAQDAEPSAMPMESSDMVTPMDAAPTAVPTPAPVDYALPYPGLLPDHSFYFLRAARDKVMAFLISSPLKKAEFDLLQADKRVEASYLLVTGGKDKSVLAYSTFSKAQNYFEEAVTKASDAKKEGMDIHEIAKRLSLANRKYVEVLNEVETKVNADERKQFEKERERVIKLGKNAKELRP
jgi:hypothetical protein